MLDAQQSAEESASKRALELAMMRRAHELEALEVDDAQKATARLEEASLRRQAEAARRERVLAAQMGATRDASVESEVRGAELRRTLRAAELHRQTELEEVRQEEASLSRQAHDAEQAKLRALAAQDERATEALLAEQREWIARRQAERAAIVEHETRAAHSHLEKEELNASQVARAQQRAMAERMVAETSQVHLAAESQHETQLTAKLEALQSTAQLAPPMPEAAEANSAEWSARMQQSRAAMAMMDEAALRNREALLARAAGEAAAAGPPPPSGHPSTEALQAALLSEALAAGDPAQPTKRVSLPPGEPQTRPKATGSGGGAAATARSPAHAPRPAFSAPAPESDLMPPPRTVASAAPPSASSSGARSAPRHLADIEAPAPEPFMPAPPLPPLQPEASPSEVRTLETLGLDTTVIASLRAHAAPPAMSHPADPEGARPSLGGMSLVSESLVSDDLNASGGRGRPSSLSSGGMAEEALGGLRLSGLDPELAERLKGAVREGRESGFGAESLRYSTAGESIGDETESGDRDVQQWLANEEARTRAAAPAARESSVSTGSRVSSVRGRIAAQEAGVAPSARSGGGASGRPSSLGGSSDAGEGGGSCPTCDAIRAQYEEHDAWVSSLKDSADAVLATHQRTRDALAGLPGGAPDESPGQGP